MKKIMFLMLGLFLLVGCTNTNENKNLDNNDGFEKSEDLKNPNLEWCQLYNPNGFDTITCVVSNPNNVDIDITYDLVFYKDGKELSRQEGWSNFQISPKHNDVIWGNDGLPKAEDVDDIKMENITVTKAYYKSLDANIKYVESKDSNAYFSITHKEKPVLNNITFFLYNDNNKNGKCDKGELVVTSTSNTIEKEDTISFETDVYNYTNYEIYYNAYID